MLSVSGGYYSSTWSCVNVHPFAILKCLLNLILVHIFFSFKKSKTALIIQVVKGWFSTDIKNQVKLIPKDKINTFPGALYLSTKKRRENNNHKKVLVLQSHTSLSVFHSC